MATYNHTATTPEEFAGLFPNTVRPFAVWYNDDPKCDNRKWAVNDESGEATQEFEDMQTAFKLASEIGKEWEDEARIQRETISQLKSKITSNSSKHKQRDKLIENLRRAGAMACMEALRIIDRIAAGDRSDLTLEECWQDEDVSIVAMQHAAGNHGEFMAGFVAVFAEYAHMFISGGEPNLYKWQPVSSMSDEEKTAHRKSAEKNASA